MEKTISLPSDKLESLIKRIEMLEAETAFFRRALQRLLGDSDQSYYWTPGWQQSEALAEEQHRNGNFTTFESGEDLIDHLHKLEAEADAI